MPALWYYQFLGEEFGPVTSDLFHELVRQGQIAEGDLVRREGEPDWQPLRKILSPQRVEPFADMFDLAPTAEAAADEAPDISAFTIVSDAKVRSRPPRNGPGWYCRSGMSQFGPLSKQELIDLAASGRLAPDDEVQEAPGAWVRAQQVEGLFNRQPEHAPAANGLPQRFSAPPPLPRPNRPKRKAPPSIKPAERVRNAGDAALPSPVATAMDAGRLGERSALILQNPPSSLAATTQPAVAEPVRQAAALHPPNTGRWAALAGLAAGVLLLGSLAVRNWHAAPPPPQADTIAYNTYVNLWVAIQQRRASQPGAEEWKSFLEETLAQTSATVGRLKLAASTNQRRRELLVEIGDRDIPDLLTSSEAAFLAAEARFQSHLDEVRKLARVNR